MELAAGVRARTLSHLGPPGHFLLCAQRQRKRPPEGAGGKGPAGSRGRTWTAREKLPWCRPACWFLLPIPCGERLHSLRLGVQERLKHSPNNTPFTAQTGLTGFHSPVANRPLITTLPKRRCHYSEMLCCTKESPGCLTEPIPGPGRSLATMHPGSTYGAGPAPFLRAWHGLRLYVMGNLRFQSDFPF